jgi:hypothetical protein
MRKLTCPALVALLILVVAAPAAHAASGSAAASAAAWASVARGGGALRAPTPSTPLVDPARGATFGLDQVALARVLAAAPAERRRGSTVTTPADGLEISIPDPDGGFQRFDIVDSPVMEPGLAAARPDLETYAGRGVDDPTATVRLDLTPIGFHASVRSDSGSWYVDPRYRDLSQYVAYDRDALSADPLRDFVEGDGGGTPVTPTPEQRRAGEANGAAVKLRVYRLALVSDNTYAANSNAGGDTTAAKVVLMNRVDQLYEQDFAIRMDLIAATPSLNLDTVAQTSGAPGPCGTTACFPSGVTCTSSSITRNNTVAGLLAGAGNYDIAHVVLGADGGGIAGLGVVGGSGKGRGCTGIPVPVGDAFAVDYVAHEMGHQFGGDHTFNGVDDNCSTSNRATGLTTVEPGSGSSVMAYAGICGHDDLQAHSDPYFSQASITQMSAYVNSAETNLSSQQTAVLTGFGGTDSFKLTYGAGTSATITNGTNYDATSIATAIQTIPGWPAGGLVTVSGVTATGFVVTFGGTLTGQAVSTLGITALSGATGYSNETVAGGPTHKGGFTVATTANHAPNVAVVGGASHTIPTRTPFVLDATGSDPDGDPLTYLWEQNDPGTMTVSGGTELVNNAKTNGPLFREFGTAARYTDPDAPTESPSPGENLATATTSRSFPDLAQVVAGNTDAATGACPVAPSDPSVLVPDATVDCFSEFLPTAAWVGISGNRIMHFRVTARDDAPGNGGVGSADAALAIAPTAGPFRVTSQASPAISGGTLPVTWDVAGTGAGTPVDTANVKITMSVDGGQTFPYTLSAATPNDGAETVALPRVATTQARIRVEAVGNVFYDVSRAALTTFVLDGPGTADLGAAAIGVAAAPVAITIINHGAVAATTGAATVSGPDAGAVAVLANGCAAVTLSAGQSCTVTLQLAPSHTGPQAATLSVADNDPASPVTVALTGTGPAEPARPTPAPIAPIAPVVPPAVTPSAAEQAKALAITLLGVKSPVLLGTAGNLRVFAASKSTRLGKPKASRTLAVATCVGGTCSGKASAKLALTSSKGKRTTRTIAIGAVKLASGKAKKLALKLSSKNRKAIAAARKASLTLTVTNGTKKVTKTFTLTT